MNTVAVHCLLIIINSAIIGKENIVMHTTSSVKYSMKLTSRAV